ncbi:MAG TPA: glycosyltransferase family 4 protein [Desulfobacterales bacterium]
MRGVVRAPIRVMHIITRLDMGGSAQNTLQTCLHLDPDRYRVMLVYGPAHESRMTADEKAAVAAGLQDAEDRGVQIRPIPYLVRRIHPLLDLSAFLVLLALLISEKPTIVHTHTSKAGILGRAAAWLMRVPIVVQTPHGHVFYGHFGRGLSKFFLSLEKLAARHTHAIVALTRSEYSDYVNYGVAGSEKLVTIHSGVDIEHFGRLSQNAAAKKKELGLNPDCPVVGTIGWLLPIKGPHHLLRAMATVLHQGHRAQLVFVGKGGMESVLRTQARSLGLADRVHFIGWRSDVADILPLFDVFVLPSLNEGMGRVLVEAMAAARPVVGSRTGGIPDLVRDGENGLLVSAGNEDELADAIGRLLSDPQWAGSLGRRGSRDCRRFSLESMVSKIDHLYRDLLAKGNGKLGC